MEKAITFVGLDAHKAALNVAVFFAGQAKPVEWQVANERASVSRMVRKVARVASGEEVRFCYEAGPCGHALQRRIREAGAECAVVAPSLIPKKRGERVKTDRRDARKLGELHRAGLLTVVHPPTPEDEAVRDLCRAREDAPQDLVRSRHRLSKLLLRRGWAWTGGKKNWSQGHRLWLRSLPFEHQADQLVFEDYLLAIEQLEERSLVGAAHRGGESTGPLRRARRGPALLPRQRHDHRDGDRGGAARLHALHISARPDGVPGSGPE
jgi:transposase